MTPTRHSERRKRKRKCILTISVYQRAASSKRLDPHRPFFIISICFAIPFFSYALIACRNRRKGWRRGWEETEETGGDVGGEERAGYKYIIISYTACVYISVNTLNVISFSSLSLFLSLSLTHTHTLTHSLTLFLAYRASVLSICISSFFLIFFLFFCVLVSFIKC